MKHTVVLALALTVLVSLAAAEDGRGSTMVSEMMQMNMQLVGGRSTELLGWQWFPVQAANMAAPYVPGGAVVSALASASPLGFVLPDGTKITARTNPPSQFYCLMESGRMGPELTNAVRRGLNSPTGTIDMASRASGERLFSVKLSGIRIKCVTLWGPGCFPGEALDGLPADRPIQAVLLQADKTELHMGR